jgi:hypothetical protein
MEPPIALGEMARNGRIDVDASTPIGIGVDGYDRIKERPASWMSDKISRRGRVYNNNPKK